MECLEHWASDADFVREFNKKSADLRIPISGSIDLTYRCNLRCIHCYLGQTSYHRQGHRYPEMNTRQILSVIDEITEAGCLFLLMTGGEPLLREDFPDIYSHARKSGLIITIFTNGTLMTDRILELFEDLPPRVVEISLYGATASTYEKITGIPGSYERCFNAIRRLLERKIAVGLKTILMTVNRHEFFDIENMAKQFGVKFRFDPGLFPRLDGDPSPLKLRVSPQEAVEKEFSDNDRAQTWKEYFRRSQGQLPNDKLYNCGAGRTGFHIDPYGKLQPCILTTGVTFDLSQGSFLTGWYDIVTKIGEKKAGNASACNQCEKRHLCGFCPPFSKLENGEEDGCSEFLCSMGHYRFAQVMNSDVRGGPNEA
jgi:radical SAM protein with 4Fe4S-binding SPASM domain